jgi:hypothetical protein
MVQVTSCQIILGGKKSRKINVGQNKTFFYEKKSPCDTIWHNPLFKRGLVEGTVTAKVLSSQKRREKEDGIGESQPFRERTLFYPTWVLMSSTVDYNFGPFYYMF